MKAKIRFYAWGCQAAERGLTPREAAAIYGFDFMANPSKLLDWYFFEGHFDTMEKAMKQVPGFSL